MNCTLKTELVESVKEMSSPAENLYAACEVQTNSLSSKLQAYSELIFEIIKTEGLIQPALIFVHQVNSGRLEFEVAKTIECIQMLAKVSFGQAEHFRRSLLKDLTKEYEAISILGQTKIADASNTYERLSKEIGKPHFSMSVEKVFEIQSAQNKLAEIKTLATEAIKVVQQVRMVVQSSLAIK
jgi:hypothetical protein